MLLLPDLVWRVLLELSIVERETGGIRLSAQAPLIGFRLCGGKPTPSTRTVNVPVPSQRLLSVLRLSWQLPAVSPLRGLLLAFDLSGSLLVFVPSTSASLLLLRLRRTPAAFLLRILDC